MPFEFNNDKWVIIQLIDLTSNGGNFGIKIYLNLYTFGMATVILLMLSKFTLP